MTGLLFTSNQTAQTRHETVGGVEFLVAPVVAIRAGVLNGELVPAEEIQHHIAAWNGRPFVVGHLEVDGEDVSVNTPGALARLQAGQLFNVKFEGDALKGEVWVDLYKAELVDGGPEVVARLESGKPLEVSTAYLRDRDEKPGTLDGVEYEAVARNLRPDHLAALLDTEGACSWADGCGAPRVNQGDDMETDQDEEPGGPDVCVCPECGYEADKERGTPCRAMTCPDCDTKLVAGDDTEEEEPEAEAANESPARSLAGGRVLCALKTIAGAFGIEFNQNTEVSKMEELIKAILEDGRLGLNAEQLQTLDEAVVKALVAALKAMPKVAEEAEPESNDDEAEQETQEQEGAEPETNEAVQALEARIVALETAAHADDEERKIKLVTALASNATCTLTGEQLKALDVATLDALAHSFSPADYSGARGGPVSHSADVTPLVMPDIFAEEVA